MEVTALFKGLDVETECLNKGQRSVTLYRQAKWLSEEALQIAEKRSEKQSRKGKIYLAKCRGSEQQGEIRNTS